MSILAKVRSYCNSLLQRQRRESDISEEIAFHIAERAVDLKNGGLSPKDALRQAKIEFGSVETHRAEIRASLGLRWADELRADLRYAWRMLWRSKGFAAVAIGSLALGIGANTVIFSLTKGVLLDRLAVPHPEELRLLNVVAANRNSLVGGRWGSGGSSAGDSSVSALLTYPIYQLMQQQNREHPVLQEFFAFKDLDNRLTASVDGQAYLVSGQMVSGNYYQQLGVQPQLGRGILPSEDAVPSDGHSVVISDSMWTRVFARAPDVVGKTISLDLVPMTIVGVNPAGFTGASTVQIEPDVFFPMSMQPVLVPATWESKDHLSVLDSTELWWVQVMARAKPGVSNATAQSALTTWLQQDALGTMKPAKDKSLPTLRVDDGSRGIGQAAHFSTQLSVLSALAGFVLLLACANLANLLLARSAARQREMAVRLALGAARGRLLRQVVTENLLLSSLGGAAGILIGYLGRNLIPHMYSASWQTTLLRSDFDPTVLGFSIAVSLLTGVLFGIAPAWQATRTPVNSSLKNATASSTRRRKGLAGHGLVIFQVALSLLLVIGAGLFAQTLRNIYKQQPGFDTSNFILFSIQAPDARYAGAKSIQLHQQLEERLSRVPGVSAVTLSRHPLLSGGMSGRGLVPTGEARRGPGQNAIYTHEVGTNFLDVYRIPILNGRSFTSSDTSTSPPVAVINIALAKKFWTNSNPAGRTFSLLGPDKTIFTVIGVVADTKYEGLDRENPPTAYFSYVQTDGTRTTEMTYEVKTALPPAAVLPQLRNAVADVDRDLPIRDVRTQLEQIDATTSQQRTFAFLTGGFGMLALILACIGIYGLLAYDVAQRTSEIGIRMALGAQASQMLSMILREASWMALAGIGVGLGSALLLTKYVKSMLYGLTPNDPWVLSGAALLLLLVALAAGFGPARRAANVEPMIALRHE